jgi:hypothetical protein
MPLETDDPWLIFSNGRYYAVEDHNGLKVYRPIPTPSPPRWSRATQSPTSASLSPQVLTSHPTNLPLGRSSLSPPTPVAHARSHQLIPYPNLSAAMYYYDRPVPTPYSIPVPRLVPPITPRNSPLMHPYHPIPSCMKTQSCTTHKQRPYASPRQNMPFSLPSPAKRICVKIPPRDSPDTGASPSVAVRHPLDTTGVSSERKHAFQVLKQTLNDGRARRRVLNRQPVVLPENECHDRDYKPIPNEYGRPSLVSIRHQARSVKTESTIRQ